MWHDRILGKTPRQTPRLQHWLVAMGVNTIWDISNWEPEEPNRWDGWVLPECLEYLEVEKIQLFNHLVGLAPIAKSRKDPRGWGRHSGSYSTSEGYQIFVAKYNVPVNPQIWNYLWKCSMLPKIEMFIWSLMHERVLTDENLEKRGLAGPFRCPLCTEASENISHLFLKCPYAISVWKDVLKQWGDGVHLPNTIQACFTSWETLYQGELNHKNGVRTCWLKLPKLIC